MLQQAGGATGRWGAISGAQAGLLVPPAIARLPAVLCCSPVRKVLGYAAIYILWGGSFLAIREVVSVVPPFFAAGFRFTLAGLVLILWSRFGGDFELSPRQLANAALLGFIMFTCLYAGLFWAEMRIPSGIAAVVSAMIPLWIYAGEVLFLRTQRATLPGFAGVLSGLAGVALLAARHRGHHAHAFATAIAIAVLIAGTLCWSGGTLLSRRLALPAPQKLNAGLQMYIGGFFLMLAAFATGEHRALPATWVILSPRVLLSMAYLIVAASIIAYTSYVWLIAHDSPTRVSSYAYVNPVIALALGVTVAGEQLTHRQMFGAALVILGVAATLMGRKGEKPARAVDDDPRPQRKISTAGLR
jgi:drug/metabolite transporter (DMT)-like permease